MIVHEIARCAVPGKRLAELLRRPRGRGTLGDCDVHDASALVGEEHEQQSARGRRHDEEVRRRDLVHVIRQERAPRL